MKITVEDVRHVADLARLGLTPEEERRFVEQLDGILRHVEKLAELDLDDVPPTSQILDPGPGMRADSVTNRPDPEGLLAGAPERADNFFKVPKIIE